MIKLEHGVTIIDYIKKIMVENSINDIYVVTRDEFRDILLLRYRKRIIIVDVAPGDGNL